VAAIRFASALDGWAFGPALYATHDGGGSWHAVSLPGSVTDLEASGGQAFAVVNHCPPSAPGCSSTLPATLWHASIAGDQWAQVPGVTGAGGAPSPSIFLHGASGWVILTGPDAVTELFFTGDGATWARVNNPCAGNTPGLWSVAAVASTVGFLCIGQGASGQEDKQLLVSTDGGRTTRLAGTPPRLGDGGTLAALSPTTWALANSSAASYIYRSTDSGHTWTTTVEFNDGGEGFSDFGFTTASQGVAIHGPRHDNAQLIISRDGGTTWNPVTF